MKENDDALRAAKAFKTLSDNLDTSQTRFGVFMTSLILVFVLVAAVFVGQLLLDEDARLQAARLTQKTEMLADSFDARMARDAERIGQLTLSLNEGGSAFSYPFAARAVKLMGEKREIAEIAVINSSGEVMVDVLSPYLGNQDCLWSAGAIPEKSILNAARAAAKNESAVFSDPYAMAQEGSPFVSLIYPVRQDGEWLFMAARVSLWIPLYEASRYTGSEGYKFGLYLKGEALVSIAGDSSQKTISHTVPLKPLSDDVILVVAHPAQQLFTQNIVFWVISSLIVFLVIALIGLIRFNARQHGIQSALAAETTLRKAISESHLIGFQVSDMKGSIVYVNNTFCKMLRAPDPETFLGQKMPYSFWPGGDESQMRRLGELGEALLTGKIRRASVEFTPERTDGTRFEALLNTTPLLTANGQQLGWLATLTDITEVHEAQKHIAEANRRFTLVVESLQSAVSVVDPYENDMVFSNPMYRTSFGETPGAHLLLHHIIMENGYRQGTFSDVYVDSLKRWFTVYERPIKWSNGHDVRLQIATDVTQRYHDESLIREQMIRNERNSRLVTMGEMASSIAHELTQPLAAIGNYAYVVEDLMKRAGVPENHEMFLSVDRIKAQADRAAAIISRVRSFTKRSEPKIEETRIDTLIRETWELALIQAKRYQAKLEQYVAPDVKTVRCDPILIEQVLLNLLRNGMEAATGLPDRMPIVTLTVYKDVKGNVVFEVADNGRGISKEAREKVFNPFYSTKKSGMGMGLNICRTIVEMHHGRLTIDDNLHEGTIFTLMLPGKAISGSK